MPCPFQWLVITDGTVSDAGIRKQVDLLSPEGFCVLEDGDWRPAITEPKGGGVWRDSQLAEGRRPADFKAQNVTESMTLTVSALDQDALIRDTQNLRRLLNKARTYGTTRWQDEPVWIEAQSPGESEMRYAVIWNYGTPNDGNPYEEQFWSLVARAGMNDFILTLEREPYWRADEPGTGTCVETGTIESYGTPLQFLEFNGATSIVTVPSNGQIDDLHDAAFTIESWIDPDGYGELSAGIVVDKGTATGWMLQLFSPNGLRGEIFTAVTRARSESGAGIGTGLYPFDGEWHHVAMTWDDAVDNYPHLWIDGFDATNTTQNRGGAIISDAGEDLIIGNIIATTQTFDGGIGWVRLSDSVRYASTFDPPARYALPPIDANTMGQWIGTEAANPIDNQEGLAAIDGTEANCVFDTDCTLEHGNTDGDTCDEEVYIANKRNEANITNIHYFSQAAGAWSANLALFALPFELLTNPIQADDVVVFGIDTSLADSGPFCSLVFDLLTAMDVATAAWKYSTVGADPTVNWLALTVQDNTNVGGLMTGLPLDTTGVGSVHWVPPAAWTEQNPTVAAVALGVTGYWVAVHVTVIGNAVPPEQQNRNIYSIVWPYVEIQSTAVLGDVVAVLQAIIRNQSDTDAGTPVEAWANRVIFGLRSQSRGSVFTAYINFADEQNPAGITIVLGGTSAYANDITAPSGRAITDTPAVPPAFNVATILFDSSISTEYTGKYHGYLRYQVTAGVPANLSVQVFGRYAAFLEFYSSPVLVPANTNPWQIFDLGRIDIATPFIGHTPNTLRFDVVASGDAAAIIKLYDLILIPVDEWAMDATDITNESGTSRLGNRGIGSGLSRHLNVDPITNPKRLVALLEVEDNSYLVNYLTVTSAPPMLQSNADQRLWFVCTRFPSTGAAEERSEPTISNTIRLNHVARYESLRGDR